jgi:phosphatidylglycerol---prolipoprotein diacylglyceryl transferase
VLAAIPYTTFPDLPFGLRTFGLMVALGVLVGARLGSDYGERFGVNREDTYRTGTLMVLAGIIGSRLTWVATHTESIEDPIDVIAIWEGGIQFAGGFIAALLVGFPMFRKWNKVQRWHVLNGYAYGLTAGVAIGRIGCYAVGEHFGRETDFFLGTRYEGGEVREEFLGDVPLRVGMVFHNTALYELLVLAALFLIMTAMIWRARRVGHEVLPVTLVALFMVYAGVERFLLDTLRVNDERFLSMTGAQWMSLVMVPYGIWLYVKTRPEVAKLVGPDGRVLEAEAGAGLLDEVDEEAEEGAEAAPDELEAPDESVAADDAEAEEEPVDAERESAEAEEEPVDAEREPADAD